MSSIQVADQTFVAAPPADAVSTLADRGNWRRWWPDLTLTVVADRGDRGFRWTVDGPMTGTSEVWLEPVLDGFVLHYFLHTEPVEVPHLPGSRAYFDWLAAQNHRRRVAGKEMSFEIKDRLDRDRDAGQRPAHAAQDGSR